MAVKRLIGVVPQEIALYDPLSARENLTFWGRMYGMGGGELRRRVDEVLEQRAAARANKDWAAADAIRDSLAAAGLTITDTKDGARWSRERG